MLVISINKDKVSCSKKDRVSFRKRDRVSCRKTICKTKKLKSLKIKKVLQKRFVVLNVKLLKRQHVYKLIFFSF